MLAVPFGAAAGAPVLAAATYGAGALVCHQRPDRSFHASGTRFPVCARCTGLYLSGALGALMAWIGLPAVPRRRGQLLVIVAAPTVITLLVEWVGVAAPSNLLRAAAALPLGAAAGWLFVRMLRQEAAPSTCAIIS
ncbi:MAG: DUF2085 domain-containing protein [Burkholderiales bacterium]